MAEKSKPDLTRRATDFGTVRSKFLQGEDEHMAQQLSSTEWNSHRGRNKSTHKQVLEDSKIARTAQEMEDDARIKARAELLVLQQAIESQDADLVRRLAEAEDRTLRDAEAQRELLARQEIARLQAEHEIQEELLRQASSAQAAEDARLAAHYHVEEFARDRELATQAAKAAQDADLARQLHDQAVAEEQRQLEADARLARHMSVRERPPAPAVDLADEELAVRLQREEILAARQRKAVQQQQQQQQQQHEAQGPLSPRAGVRSLSVSTSSRDFPPDSEYASTGADADDDASGFRSLPSPSGSSRLLDEQLEMMRRIELEKRDTEIARRVQGAEWPAP